MRTKPIPEDYFHNCLLKGFNDYKKVIYSILEKENIHIFDGI